MSRSHRRPRLGSESTSAKADRKATATRSAEGAADGGNHGARTVGPGDGSQPHATSSWRSTLFSGRSMKRTGLLLALLLGVGFCWIFAWRPWSQLRHLQAARVAQQQGDLAEAQTQLLAALKLEPNDPETLRLLARNARRNSDPQAFRRYLDQARQQGAEPELVDREETLLLAQAGQLREAEPKLPTLLQAARGDEQEICRAFVQGYLLNLRLADADRLLDSWEQDYPRAYEPYLLRGYARESVSQFEAAETAYRRALQLAPDRTEVIVRLAHVLLERRQIDKVYELLRQARARRPNVPEIELVWAQCLHQQGDFAEARTVLQSYLTQSPNDASAAGLLGRIELAEKNWDAAIQALQTAAQVQPQDTTIRYALGQALQAAGKPTEAQVHFDYVARAAGPLDELEAILEQILREPEKAELRYRAGTILMDYGSPDDGAKWLRSVVQLEPQHRAAHERLAEYHAARGENKLAEYHRRAASL